MFQGGLHFVKMGRLSRLRSEQVSFFQNQRRGWCQPAPRGALQGISAIPLAAHSPLYPVTAIVLLLCFVPLQRLARLTTIIWVAVGICAIIVSLINAISIINGPCLGE